MIGGPLLYFFGRQQGDDTESGEEDSGYTIKGYAVILGLSSVYFLFSALSLRWIKNLHV
jgi:hypothetical protein